MKIVKILSRKYGVFETLVDDEDFDWVSSQKLFVNTSNTTSYVVVRVGTKTYRLHRLIVEKYTNIPEKCLIDHINRNGLDNRKENLRLATYTGNSRNTGGHKDRKCQYKGVSRKSDGSKWRVCIGVEDKVLHGGDFESEYDAAIAYDLLAKKHHKEFACLNIVDAPKEDVDRIKSILNNPKTKKNTSSKYYGVCYIKPSKKWRAFIKADKKVIHAKGGFNTEFDAAKYRDKYIKENKIIFFSF